MADDRTCVLCGNPIAGGEAWMESESDGVSQVAHAGCVYRDEDQDARQRWMAAGA